MVYFLAGNFNDWRPDDPDFRFTEVTDPYGGNRKDLVLASGSYVLETDLPKSLLQFKIVEDGSWDHQWSAKGSAPDKPGKFGKYGYKMRHGLSSGYIVYCGGGTPPHAEFHYPGGRRRWDFHPESRSLAIHDEFQRSDGLRLMPWRTFDCGEGLVFDTCFALPYGYDQEGPALHTTSLIFDERSLFYGEDSTQGVWNHQQRQWPRIMDTLARHGLITPTVAIGVGVPRRGEVRLRRETCLETGSMTHKLFARTFFDVLLPAVKDHFRVRPSFDRKRPAPESCCLFGHSNGGDLALALLAQRPELFGGAVAVSPGAVSTALDLPAKCEARLAIAYAADDLTASFSTYPALIKHDLEKLDVPHLIQYMPDSTHDPVTAHKFMFGCFAYVMK